MEQTTRLLQRLEAQLVQVPEELGAELRQQVPSAALLKKAVACRPEFRAFMAAADPKKRAAKGAVCAVSWLLKLCREWS